MTNFNELDGFAVDLGGTKLAAAHIKRGQLIERKQVTTAADADAVSQCKSMANLLREVGWAKEPVGIAVAGRVTSDGRWSAVNKGTLTGIDETPFRDIAGAHLGVPLVLANDGIAAASAEARFGAGEGVRSFAYITISTGVGGGVVIDGQPLVSENGLVGHIGFMSSRFAEKKCGSGRFATVESVAGGRAIAAAALEFGHEIENAKQVFEAAQDGQSWAKTVIDQSACAIALLVADLTSMLGLERVAIGGSIGLAEGYLQQVQLCLNEEPALFRPQIVPAALGHDSALLGVLNMAKVGAAI